MFEVQDINGEKKIIAKNRIAKGTELCKFSGKLISYDETLTLKDKESFALQIEKDVYVYLDEPYRYFNHCCEPNCGLTPGLELITLYDIPGNEELRYDYSTTMLEHHWSMKCKCHKPSCRHVITDFDKLPKKVQEKYREWNVVQTFILDFLDKKKPAI